MATLAIRPGLQHASTRQSCPRLRLASLQDYDQVAALEARHDLVPRSRQEWQHLWTGNPAYTEHWPVGWVLETESGELVGTLGNIPLRSEFKGQVIRTASGRAWVVDPQYRGYALLLMHQFFSQPDVDLLLNTTVNVHARDALSTFDTAPVPVAGWDESLFWITDYYGFSTSWLKVKSVPLCSAIGYPLALGLETRDRFARPRVRRGSTRSIVAAWAFDDRFETFWRRLQKSRPNVLLSDRSQTTLAWHYHFALREGRLWIFTASRAGELLGYSIFYRQDTPTYGLKRIRLADFQSLDWDPDLLISMFYTALDRCKAEGIHMLEVFGLSLHKRSILERLRPQRRRLPAWMYFYTARPKELNQELRSPSRWDPSSYDGDSTL